MEPKIVSIAGHGRSGSTLLARVLGQADDFFTLGELRHIWRRSVIENQLCGCGKAFSECNFWSEVIRDAYGAISKKDAENMERLFRGIHSRVKMPFILWQSLQTDNYKKMLHEWKSVMLPLFRSIGKVSGARYLIDSTGLPTYGMLLRQILDEDRFCVVHLIRDPRAVAYSRIRKKHRPEIHWKKEFMGITPPYKTAFQWLVLNKLCDKLCRETQSYRFRYEDLMDNPESSLKELIQAIREHDEDLDFIIGNRIRLDLAHTTAGNPMRFKTGEIDLVKDMEWEHKLSGFDKFVVTAVDLPAIYKYGYRLSFSINRLEHFSDSK